MARLPRIKAQNSGDAFYHLYARVSGVKGYYPLADSAARNNLLWTIKFYASLYKMRVAGFTIMGNHYHLVTEFEEFKELSREELKEIYHRFYGEDDKRYILWSPAKWEQFNRRLYDVSEYMRNVQAKFARSFNDRNRRKGTFWGSRFKSTLLEDERALRDCLYYVELNPVRAGIVERPEDYEGSSLYYRETGKDHWMMPLTEIMHLKKRGDSLRDYKASVYYRGSVRTKQGQHEIPAHIIEQEEQNGFAGRGSYRRRIRYFVDGVVLGSTRFVKQHLKNQRNLGGYSQRKHPVKPKDGNLKYLRPQRKSEVFIG